MTQECGTTYLSFPRAAIPEDPACGTFCMKKINSSGVHPEMAFSHEEDRPKFFGTPSYERILQ